MSGRECDGSKVQAYVNPWAPVMSLIRCCSQRKVLGTTKEIEPSLTWARKGPNPRPRLQNLAIQAASGQ